MAASVKLATVDNGVKNNGNHNNSNHVVPYGRIILTLENCLLPKDKIEVTCSAQDGLDKEAEMDLRILGTEMIQTGGILLKLPQVAMATGQVLFHRFFYSKSLIKYNYEVVSMGCLCLASKIEEAPRRIRDVINVFNHIKQIRSNRTIQPVILDQNYINLKNQVIKAERRVLKELGFCVHVKHPHKIIVMYLQVLELKNNQHLTQLAWNYMNDSLRTDVFLRFCPETIACTCIYLSARQLKIPLPNKPAWYRIFQVEEDDIHVICIIILKLYARPKSNVEKLEKIVDDLKKAQEEAKQKAKGLSASNTPQGGAGFSPNSRSSSPNKTDKSPTDNKKEKSLENNKAKSYGDGHTSPSRRSESTKDTNNHGSKGQSPSSNTSGGGGGAKSGGSHSSRSRTASPKRKGGGGSGGGGGGGSGHRHSSRNTASRSGGGSYKRSRGKSASKSRSRSKSVERGNHKKPRGRPGGVSSSSGSKHARRSRSPSPVYMRSPVAPHHRNHKKNHKEKLRYRSRSRDIGAAYRSRSRSYDGKYSTTTKSGGGRRKERRVGGGRDNGHHRSRSDDRNHRR